MKASLVLSLIVLYTVNALPTGEDDHDHSTHEHFTEAGPFTTIQKTTHNLGPVVIGRRYFGSGDSRTNYRCAAQCARQLVEKTKRDLPSVGQGETSMSDNFDPERLSKFCTIHDSTKTCLARCQSSEVKTMLTKALSVGQYACHDSTLKRNAPCLNEVHKTAKISCEGQSKCGQYKEKLDQYKRNSPTNEEGLKDLLKNTCQFMKCGMDCVKPTVVSKCGQSAQNDFQGLIGKSVELLKYTVENSELGHTYPRECERLTVA